MSLKDLACIKCPACFGSKIVDRGKLPDIPPERFTGPHPEIIIDGGNFLHCQECGLFFRYPCLPQPLLEEFYRDLPLSSWNSMAGSNYWLLISRLAERYKTNRKVLDVGCFKGDFLQSLPGDWQRLGIELNLSARREASQKGVELIGETPQRLVSKSNDIGVITVISTLEHVSQPLKFLEPLVDMLAPGGSMIIATGAADSFFFRIFGCYYWYAAVPEHVSYFSLKWFRWAAKQLGLSIVCVRYSFLSRLHFIEFLHDFLVVLLYTLSRSMLRLTNLKSLFSKIPILKRIMSWEYCPMLEGVKDHMVIVLKKDGR